MDLTLTREEATADESPPDDSTTAVNAEPEASMDLTLTREEATADESPPLNWSPQVTTLPSTVSAANATWFAYSLETPPPAASLMPVGSSRQVPTSVLHLPPFFSSPHACTVPSSSTAENAKSVAWIAVAVVISRPS